MRIAVSSRSFRRPLASHGLTQLEWVERCASALEVDGIVADVSDFPRTDGEYVAQLRKVAVDLGIVPFGIDAAHVLEPDPEAVAREAVLALAAAFGAAVIRTLPPAPGDVPPAAFSATVAVGKLLSRAAKAVNITVLVADAPGTLGSDLAAVKHLLKDTDSAWLRACPRALDEGLGIATRDRFPALTAMLTDDPAAVATAARNAWLIVDASSAPEDPWDAFGAGIRALRAAEARLRLGAAS